MSFGSSVNFMATSTLGKIEKRGLSHRYCRAGHAAFTERNQLAYKRLFPLPEACSDDNDIVKSLGISSNDKVLALGGWSKTPTISFKTSMILPIPSF